MEVEYQVQFTDLQKLTSDHYQVTETREIFISFIKEGKYSTSKSSSSTLQKSKLLIELTLPKYRSRIST